MKRCKHENKIEASAPAILTGDGPTVVTVCKDCGAGWHGDEQIATGWLYRAVRDGADPAAALSRGPA